jgi:hypothetical protein
MRDTEKPNAHQTAKPEADRLAYSINSFCRWADIGRTTAYAEIRAGRLKAKKRRGRRVITAEAARAYHDNLPDVPADA